VKLPRPVGVLIDVVMAWYGLMLIAVLTSLAFTLDHIEFRVLAILVASGTAWALAPGLREVACLVQSSSRRTAVASRRDHPDMPPTACARRPSGSAADSVR